MLNSTVTASPLSGPPHFVDLHVNPGESVSIQLFDGNETILRGPATITMISQHTFPPIPMPVQVPPGHMIQQIVDENGTLRHIILSALNSNGSTPSTTALMPQQSQQQQSFPYCCCCCYSCTGTTPTAPLPPPPPPPPPPQIHHNILAFPTQPNRRRINPMNRTFSPAGKRSTPTYYNNNSLGKSPVRNKIGSSASASVDGVSKVSYANSKHNTTPDTKPYELNSNRVMVGKVNHNENCLSDTKHVLNSTCINKESLDIGINKNIMETDGSIISQTRSAPPFSYTSMEEHKDMNGSHDMKNCSHSHFDAPKNSPILIEINLSNSSRGQENIKEEDENEEEDNQVLQVDHGIHINQNEVPVNHLSNCQTDEQIETSRVDDNVNDVSESCDESLNTEFEHNNVKCVELIDKIEQIDEQIIEMSCIRIAESQSNQMNSSMSSTKQDNHNIDHKSDKQTVGHNYDKWTAKQLSLELELNKQLNDRSDSISCNESQTDESEVIKQTECPVQRPTEEKHTNGLTDYMSVSNASNEERNEGQAFDNELGKNESIQRSPKHLLPQLELLNLTYTSLTANTVKLKWTYTQPHSTQDQLFAKHYLVEMLLNKLSTDNNSQNCRIVFQGHSNNCRIPHLNSQQQYSFRVRTTSEEHLVVSNVLTITTPEQQSVSNKYNKKSKQLLQQQIQQQQHQIHQQQLLLQQQQQLQDQSRVNTDIQSEPAITSDQRCAILLLLLFTLFALIVAVLIQQLLTD